MIQTFTLPRAVGREGQIQRIAKFLAGLSPEKGWAVKVDEHKPKRSLPQNALLWALYGDVIERGGEAMRGWNKDDLHDFFLIEAHGAERVTMFGRTKLRPTKRTSTMTKQELTDHIHFIVSFMAGQGVLLDLPDSEAA
jgi:hypothetical protein